MVKSGQRADVVPRPYQTGSYYGHERTTFAETLEGRYGKRHKRKYRSQNAVIHQKETVISRGYTEWDYQGWGSRYFELEAEPRRGEWLHNQLWSQMSDLEYKLLHGLQKRLQPTDLSFNLFNFLYEAREIPSLLDPAKVVMKRMTSRIPRGTFKKAGGKEARKWLRGTLNDIADTYLGATFGWVPTYSDGNALMERVQHLSDSYKAITRLRDTVQRFAFSQDLPVGPVYAGRAVDPNVIDADNSENEVTLFVKKAKCTVSGSYRYEIPMLESFVFLSSAMDNAGLHFDLATIWNAVPFSWLVDWVVPIGDALEADRKPWTEIVPVVEGTISWKIEYEIRYPKLSYAKWAGRLYTSQEPGLLTGTYYVRNPLPASVEPYRYPPFSIFGWSKNGTKRAGILAALGLRALYKR